MIFTVKEVSAGIARGTIVVQAPDLRTLANDLQARIAILYPRWAFLQCGATCSLEVTW